MMRRPWECDGTTARGARVGTVSVEACLKHRMHGAETDLECVLIIVPYACVRVVRHEAICSSRFLSSGSTVLPPSTNLCVCHRRFGVSSNHCQH